MCQNILARKFKDDDNYRRRVTFHTFKRKIFGFETRTNDVYLYWKGIYDDVFTTLIIMSILQIAFQVGSQVQ